MTQAVQEVRTRLEAQWIVGLGLHQLAGRGQPLCALQLCLGRGGGHIVVQAALHAHQVAHGHHPPGRAHGVALPHRQAAESRQPGAHRVVQAHRALFDQLHRGAGGEHLGAGIQPIQLVAPNRLLARHVPVPGHMPVNGFVIPVDRQVAPRHAHRAQGIHVFRQCVKVQMIRLPVDPQSNDLLAVLYHRCRGL